ncbi:MAG: hypothetical protein ACK5P8_01085, partial [Phycisphaerae bacterium]
PGCTVTIAGIEVKLLRVREVAGAEGEPGVVRADGCVAAAAGSIEILEVQPVGGRAMPWSDFVRGRPQVAGERLLPRP